MNSWVAASIKKWSFVQGLGILRINGRRKGFQLAEKLHVYVHTGTRTHTEFCLGFEASGLLFVQSYADKSRNVYVFVSKSRIILSLKRKM